MKRAVLACALVACGARSPRPAPRAGSDDGSGDLARASTSLVTTADRDDDPAPRTPPRAAFGGAAYGNWTPPRWGTPDAQRRRPYEPRAGLGGVVVGTVAWAKPPRAAGPCARPHGARAAGAVLVIARVAVGRPAFASARPLTVGGTVAKHGCALEPALQLVAPLPAALSIHGDAAGAKLRVTSPGGEVRAYEVEPGGRAQLQVHEGLTRVEAEDGSLAPAWVLGADAAYYAITDDDGRFRIDELAPGTYDVAIYAVAGGAPVVVHRAVAVELGRAARLDVSL